MKMVDTHGIHYAIVLETRQVPDSNVLFVEDESQDVLILLLDDKQGDLCSLKAVRKVQKIYRHKGKDQCDNGIQKHRVDEPRPGYNY